MPPPPPQVPRRCNLHHTEQPRPLQQRRGHYIVAGGTGGGGGYSSGCVGEDGRGGGRCHGAECLGKTLLLMCVPPIQPPRILPSSIFLRSLSLPLPQADAQFLPELFLRLAKHTPDDAEWRDLVAFLQVRGALSRSIPFPHFIERLCPCGSPPTLPSAHRPHCRIPTLSHTTGAVWSRAATPAVPAAAALHQAHAARAIRGVLGGKGGGFRV